MFSVHVTKVDARFPAVSAVIRKQVLAQCAKKRCGSLPGTQESSGLAQRAKNQCLPIVSRRASNLTHYGKNSHETSDVGAQIEQKGSPQ